jgi:hypothetical protein
MKTLERKGEKRTEEQTRKMYGRRGIEERGRVSTPKCRWW